MPCTREGQWVYGGHPLSWTRLLRYPLWVRCEWVSGHTCRVPVLAVTRLVLPYLHNPSVRIIPYRVVTYVTNINLRLYHFTTPLTAYPVHHCTLNGSMGSRDHGSYLLPALRIDHRQLTYFRGSS